MARHERCNHDDGWSKVYSGQINLSRKFAWICWRCGEHGWSEDYVLSHVNLDEYHRLRVAHGWASPPKRVPPRHGHAPRNLTPTIPPPPRLPTNLEAKRSASPEVAIGLAFFGMLSVLGPASAIPWGNLGPVLPPWASLLMTVVALGTATLFYLIWRRNG